MRRARNSSPNPPGRSSTACHQRASIRVTARPSSAPAATTPVISGAMRSMKGPQSPREREPREDLLEDVRPPCDRVAEDDAHDHDHGGHEEAPRGEGGALRAGLPQHEREHPERRPAQQGEERDGAEVLDRGVHERAPQGRRAEQHQRPFERPVAKGGEAEERAAHVVEGEDDQGEHGAHRARGDDVRPPPASRRSGGNAPRSPPEFSNRSVRRAPWPERPGAAAGTPAPPPGEATPRREPRRSPARGAGLLPTPREAGDGALGGGDFRSRPAGSRGRQVRCASL